MRVLVIEDEEKLAGIISRGLRAEGFAVDIANDGERGLQLATSHSYDLIILDIMLPKRTGTEVLSSIREKNNHVPIMMLTARDTVDHKVKHLDMGADDYLTKPLCLFRINRACAGIIAPCTGAACRYPYYCRSGNRPSGKASKACWQARRVKRQGIRINGISGA